MPRSVGLSVQLQAPPVLSGSNEIGFGGEKGFNTQPGLQDVHPGCLF